MSEGEPAPAAESTSWQLPSHPNELLAKKLAKDWLWLNQAVTEYHDEGTTRLREFIRDSRISVEVMASFAQNAYSAAEATLSAAQQPSERMQRYKTALFDFRRKYPAAIVGFAAAVSVLPAVLLKQTSRLERARILVRNAVIGGGTTSVLLYPEFVMRTASNVDRAASKVEALEFEAFLLSELCSDLVACSGHEAYVLCTMQVALGFLRVVDLSDG